MTATAYPAPGPQHAAHLDEEHPVFVQHKHPNYVGIFFILLVFTILEVWVTTPFFGIAFPLPILTVPTLLVLAVLKFATIAGYYMHLRFDSRAFTTLFAFGLMLAIGMLFTLQGLFLAHYRIPFNYETAREEGHLPAPGGASATPAAGTSTGTAH